METKTLNDVTVNETGACAPDGKENERLHFTGSLLLKVHEGRIVRACPGVAGPTLRSGPMNEISDITLHLDCVTTLFSVAFAKLLDFFSVGLVIDPASVGTGKQELVVVAGMDNENGNGIHAESPDGQSNVRANRAPGTNGDGNDGASGRSG